MDTEWLKDGLAVIAQHGPWAVLAFYLAWKSLKTSEAQTEAMIRVAEALTALKTHIEVSLPKGGRHDD